MHLQLAYKDEVVRAVKVNLTGSFGDPEEDSFLLAWLGPQQGLASLYTACSRSKLRWAAELLFVSIGRPIPPICTRAFLRLPLQLGSLATGVCVRLCPSLGAGGVVANHVSVRLGGGDVFGWAWWASDT